MLGESGAGKTASAVLPVVAAMARAPSTVLGAALVIDPKRELAPVLEGLARARVHHVSAATAVLDVMSGPRWRLDDDLAAGRWLSAARRILCRSASFVPASPARVLLANAPRGVGDADLAGQHIDVAAASALVESCDLIVAHNARFDRPFCERVLPATRHKPWACSRLEVPWRAAGCPSDALHCLLCHHGVYSAGRHRALADCEAGVWLLAQTLPGTERGVFAELYERAQTESVRLWALHTPIEAKGVLRARGYRWMPAERNAIPRSWWTELAPELVAAEEEWLRAEVYAPHRPWARHPAARSVRQDSAPRHVARAMARRRCGLRVGPAPRRALHRVDRQRIHHGGKSNACIQRES